MNIAIINQNDSKYLFEVPESITLKEGEKVKCDTRRGVTDGTVWADSITVDEPAAKLIGKLLGAKFPLKSVVGKTVTSVEMFEQPEQPKQEDKPTYRAGDKVRIIGNCNPIIHYADVGSVQTVRRVFTDSVEIKECFQTISFADIEPYTAPESTEPKLIVTRRMLEEMGACNSGVRAFMENFPSGEGEFDAVVAKAKEIGRGNDACWLETRKRMVEEKQNEPKQEPVKLYCVEDYSGFTTKGKIYEFTGGDIRLDDGYYIAGLFTDYADFVSYNGDTALCLVPLVSRPAKVGEWIYITKSGDPRANEGSIYEVAPYDLSGRLFVRHPCGNRFSDGAANISPSEYLVLDGYTPEPEKAEPEYLNMKVVCTKLNHGVAHTVGKVYEVKNGFLTCDSCSHYNPRPYMTLKSLNEDAVPDFIEFKGE